MSELTLFRFETAQIRVLLVGGLPWFVAKDVCTAVGLSNPSQALADHVDEEDRNTLRLAEGNRGNPNQAIINESGMYALIMSSRLESAKRFKRWVTGEVLPTIRKTGLYGTPRNALQTLPSTVETQIAVHSLLRGALVQAGVIPQMAGAAMLRACVVDGLLTEAAEREYRTVLGVDWDDSPNLTPTQIGKELGGLPAIKVNKMLETRGLQRNAASAGERPRWEPTEVGKPYCGAVPFKAKNDHHGMQLKWTPRVLEILREPLPESRALPEPEPKKEYLF